MEYTYGISRFIPPHLDREKSNVENSENTTLFLVSCYEYILSGIVLSVGPPFRQSIGQNRELSCSYDLVSCFANFSSVPFVVTIVVVLLFSSYMLLDPSKWLAEFMQLTYMSWDFKLFILILGAGYIVSAWVAENYILPRLGKYIGVLQILVTGTPKRRKTYKLVLEQMHALQ